MTLPVRPSRIAGEAPSSFVIRMTTPNGWTADKLWTALTGRDHYGVQMCAAMHRPGAFREICRSLGMDIRHVDATIYSRESGLIGAMFQWEDLLVSSSSIRTDCTPFCPACASTDEVPHGRSAWDHRLVKSCGVHFIRLLEACPACKRRLTLGRDDYCHCLCGYDLRQAPRVAVSGVEHSLIDRARESGDRRSLDFAMAMVETLDEMQRAGSVHCDDIHTLALRCVDEPALLQQYLIKAPGPTVSIRVALRRLLIGQLRSMGTDFIARLPNILSIGGDWCATLSTSTSKADAQSILGVSSRHLSRLIGGGHLETVTPRRATRLTTTSINQALLLTVASDRPAQYIVDSVACDERFDVVFADLGIGAATSLGYELSLGLRSLRIARPPEARPASSGTCTIHELASRAGVHYELIRVLVVDGFIPSLPRSFSRASYLLSIPDADAFLTDYCFAGPLARQAGVGATSFADKLRASGLSPVSGPGIDKGIAYLFKRTDIERLDLSVVAQMTRYPTRTGRPLTGTARPRAPANSVTFAEAAETLGVSVQIVAQLAVAGILTGVDSPHRERYVTTASLDAAVTERRDPSRLQITEAATAVGETRHQFIRRWMITGVVRAADTPFEKMVLRSDVETVQEMKSSLVVGVDACAHGRLHRTHLNNHLRIRGIPVTQLSGGARGLNLFAPLITADEVRDAHDTTSSSRRLFLRKKREGERK